MPAFRIFATRSDYEQLVAAHERLAQLFFVRDGFYEPGNVEVLHGMLAVPNLGGAILPGEHGRRYWVHARKPRPRLERIGTPRSPNFVLDTRRITVAIWFEPEGMYVRENEEMMIAGLFQANINDSRNLSIFRAVSRCFEKEFTKAKLCDQIAFAGPEALRLQREGLRLVESYNLPRSLDLKVKKSQLPRRAEPRRGPVDGAALRASAKTRRMLKR
jgi:hypothetical protein